MTQIYAETDMNEKKDGLNNFIESSKKLLTKWTVYDAETQRGSLAGRVFTGCYALLFGWFFFHSIIYFRDILFTFNIPSTTYLYYTGSFLLSVLISGGILLFLTMILSVESLSDNDAMRWPLRIGNTGFAVGLLTSNMASEPYPDLKRSWLDSELRYPEFMGYQRFYPLLILFLNDMSACFASEDPDASETYMFRPWRQRAEKDKQMIYEENFVGLAGVAFLYFSYWYFMFVYAENVIEGVFYYVGIRFIRSYFGRGQHFESGRKLWMLTFSFVPILAMIQGYFAYRHWRTYDEHILFCAKSVVLLLHILIFAGWMSSQDSVLGSMFLPYKRKAGFEDYDKLPGNETERGKSDEDDDDEEED